jgi:hypothetical protein
VISFARRKKQVRTKQTKRNQDPRARYLTIRVEYHKRVALNLPARSAPMGEWPSELLLAVRCNLCREPIRGNDDLHAFDLATLFVLCSICAIRLSSGPGTSSNVRLLGRSPPSTATPSPSSGFPAGSPSASPVDSPGCWDSPRCLQYTMRRHRSVLKCCQHPAEAQRKRDPRTLLRTLLADGMRLAAPREGCPPNCLTAI